MMSIKRQNMLMKNLSDYRIVHDITKFIIKNQTTLIIVLTATIRSL